MAEGEPNPSRSAAVERDVDDAPRPEGVSPAGEADLGPVGDLDRVGSDPADGKRLVPVTRVLEPRGLEQADGRRARCRVILQCQVGLADMKAGAELEERLG